jgi:hypothetical protein
MPPDKARATDDHKMASAGAGRGQRIDSHFVPER